jgi:integrase
MVEEMKALKEPAATDTAATSSSGLPTAAFSGFARIWVEQYVRVNCKPSHIRRYEGVVRAHLVPYFQDRLLTDISAYDVEAFRAALIAHGTLGGHRPYAPKTLNNYTSTLSSMLDAAVRWGYLNANPCRRVRLLRIPPREMRFWTAEQTRVFLDKVQVMEPQWFPFFLTGFRTGMRLGELFGLQWGDIDFTQRRICVRRSVYKDEFVSPKNNKVRWIPMTSDLERTLSAAKHLKGDLVFSRPDGTPLTRDIVKHPFDRITFAAGLPAIRLHDARHSFASQLAMAGVSLLAISKLLGHSGVQITERYAHLSPSSLDEAVKVLEGKDSMAVEARGQ